MKIEPDIMIHISHGVIGEKVRSIRYSWDNQKRGSDPYVILQWTHSGSGVFELGKRKYGVGEGKAFIALVPESSRYSYLEHQKDPWVFSWINFHGSLAQQLWGKLREAHGPVLDLSLTSPLFLSLRQMIWKTVQRQWSDRLEMSQAAYLFFLQVWHHVENPAKLGSEDGLEWAQRSLRDHFRSPMVVKELADQMQWSREHFSREYRNKFGVAPGTELRQLRLEEACRLLKSTGWPIHEVAVRSGFSNATQLGVRFQKNFRMTPARYRAKNSFL